MYGEDFELAKYKLHFQSKIHMRDAMSITFLQQFYNKSQVVSCYWFKFETNTKITFLP